VPQVRAPVLGANLGVTVLQGDDCRSFLTPRRLRQYALRKKGTVEIGSEWTCKGAGERNARAWKL
jgi:allophanate hydrolase subunit 1